MSQSVSAVLKGGIAYRRKCSGSTITMPKTKTPKKKTAAKKIGIRIHIVPLEKVPIPGPGKK